MKTKKYKAAIKKGEGIVWDKNMQDYPMQEFLDYVINDLEKFGYDYFVFAFEKGASNDTQGRNYRRTDFSRVTVSARNYVVFSLRSLAGGTLTAEARRKNSRNFTTI